MAALSVNQNNRTYTEKLTEFALEYPTESIPAEVKEKVIDLIIDSVGVSLANSVAPYATKMERALRKMNGGGKSTAIGYTRGLNAGDAAMLNSATIHGSDFEATHLTSIIHPSSIVLPTAFAVAESMGSSGIDLIGAAAIGSEILIRMGLPVRGVLHNAGFQATALYGPVASTMIIGRLSNMTREETVSASGLSAVMSSGLRAFSDDGTWGKRVITGWACKAGLTAAALARENYPGTRDVLEKRWGLYSAFVGKDSCDLSELDKNLGVQWETLDVSIKKYPISHGHEPFVDSAIAAGRESGLNVDQIKCIRCHVSREAKKWWFEPRHKKMDEVLTQPYGAKFSLAYTVALGFCFGELLEKHFDKAILGEPSIRKLAERVTPQVDEGITDTNPNILRGALEIVTTGGDILRFEGNENESRDEHQIIVDKFRSNMRSHNMADSGQQILSSIRTIEKCQNIATLGELLRLGVPK